MAGKAARKALYSVKHVKSPYPSNSVHPREYPLDPPNHSPHTLSTDALTNAVGVSASTSQRLDLQPVEQSELTTQAEALLAHIAPNKDARVRTRTRSGLTDEELHIAIAKALQHNPEASNVAIADVLKCDRETVAKVRRALAFDVKIALQLRQEQAVIGWGRAIETAAEKGDHRPARELLQETGSIEREPAKNNIGIAVVLSGTIPGISQVNTIANYRTQNQSEGVTSQALTDASIDTFASESASETA